jgi:uncharacterized integral membrane protein
VVVDFTTVTGRLKFAVRASRTYTVALPALTPKIVSVALVVVTLDNATFTTAVFFDSAWTSPLALLTLTATLLPAATVTCVGASVSAAARPANSAEPMSSMASANQ